MRTETLERINRYAIPRGSLATVAGVAQSYVSNYCCGKEVPAYASDRIREAAVIIAEFIEHVRTFGFSPDLTNGIELRDWIVKRKAQNAQEKISSATAVD